MSRDLRKKAKELSGHGRYGDSTLLHVNPLEVKGLESLIPGGKLPRNPKTGLPEAFFFLPFLAAAAAPAAAATTAAAAAPALIGTGAALGGAAAGLGAAGAAGAGAAGLGALGAAALPTAAETAGALGAAGAGASGLTSAGLAGGALGTNLAADLPMAGNVAATSAGVGGIGADLPFASGAGITSLGPAAGVDTMTTGAIGSSGGANALVGGGAGMSSAPSVIAPPAVATPSTVAGPLSPASSGALSSPAAGVTAPMGTGAATPLTSGTPMASAAGAKGGLGGLMGNLGNMDLMKLAPLAMLMPRGGGGGDDDKKSKKKISNDYNGPEASFPDSDYQGGIDPEWNYFPRMNNGGMVQRYAAGGIVGLGAPSVMNQSPSMMQGQAMAPQGGMMNSAPTAPMPAGGGGIAQLMQPPTMAPPAQLDSPYAGPSGAPKSPGKGGGKSDEELIAATVEALQGRSPNPDAVISAFVQTFGQNALQDLMARIQQTSPATRSDGQSDSVPGLIDGNQPAALSSGEFVVPSDVVSGLGNGSTDAGANALNEMVGRTRMARGGIVGQPPSINPRHMMPS